MNEFNKDHLNPYINFHKPCFFPETQVDSKEKIRKRYSHKDMMTPYEKLKSLPQAAAHLKTGINFEILDQVALKMSDNQAADLLQKARQKLFRTINERDLNTA